MNSRAHRLADHVYGPTTQPRKSAASAQFAGWLRTGPTRRNLHSAACFPVIAHKRTRARSSIWRSSDGLYYQMHPFIHRPAGFTRQIWPHTCPVYRFWLPWRTYRWNVEYDHSINAFHISVLHRVVVDIILVCFIVPLITYHVFPKTALPDGGFFPSPFWFVHPILRCKSRPHRFCYRTTSIASGRCRRTNIRPPIIRHGLRW